MYLIVFNDRIIKVCLIRKKENKRKKEKKKEKGERKYRDRFRHLRQPSIPSPPPPPSSHSLFLSIWIKENAVKLGSEIRLQFQRTFQDGTEGSFYSILSTLGVGYIAEKRSADISHTQRDRWAINSKKCIKKLIRHFCLP